MSWKSQNDKMFFNDFSIIYSCTSYIYALYLKKNTNTHTKLQTFRMSYSPADSLESSMTLVSGLPSKSTDVPSSSSQQTLKNNHQVTKLIFVAVVAAVF